MQFRNEERMMKRAKYIVFSSIALALIVLTFVIKYEADQEYAKKLAANQEQESATAKDNAELDVKVNPAGGVLFHLGKDVYVRAASYEYELEQQQTIEKYHATDTILTFNVRDQEQALGTLTTTIRQIDRGDKLVFAEFLSVTQEPVTIPLQLVSNSSDVSELRFDDIEFVREHDNTFGVNETTNLAGLFRFEGRAYEVIASQNFISRELVKEYEDGDKSVVRELIEEQRHVVAEQRGEQSVVAMPLTGAAGQISESWFLVGANALFNNDADALYYRDYSEIYHIRSQMWLNATGAYTKLPWSIEPSTSKGYGRNVLHQRGKIYLDELVSNGDTRFHYSMLMNSINYLLDRKVEGQLWETEYTSTWLKNDYGIRAPYTDTRHNENIALFLTDAGDYLGDEMLQNMYFEYADYLSNQVNIDNVLATENGYFILDYYGDTLTKKTHVSLNHALGEMNFLLQAYGREPNQRYMNTAIAIKQAIEDTGLQWVREDTSDFWYQINGDYTFSGRDYEVLTLGDILNTLTIYKNLGLKYDPVLYATMIGHKVGYINLTGIPVTSALENALKHHGFGFLLTPETERDDNSENEPAKSAPQAS